MMDVSEPWNVSGQVDFGKPSTLYKTALFDAKSAKRSEGRHWLLDIFNGSKIKFHR